MRQTPLAALIMTALLCALACADIKNPNPLSLASIQGGNLEEAVANATESTCLPLCVQISQVCTDILIIGLLDETAFCTQKEADCTLGCFLRFENLRKAEYDKYPKK